MGSGIAADFVEAGLRRVIGKTIVHLHCNTGVARNETGVRKLLKCLLFSEGTAAVDPNHQAPFVNHLKRQ